VFSPQQRRPDLPPHLARLISESLSPDPRDRFPDARAFADACRETLNSVHRPPTGEATELKLMLHALLPPGSLTKPRPAAKVIRLAPDLWSDETAPESSIRAQPPVEGELQSVPSRPAHRTAALQPASTILVAPPQIISPHPTLPTPFGTAAAYLTPQMTPLAKKPKSWGRPLLVVAALIGAAAALVHLTVIPLPVAAVWLQPADLSITSQPPGAEIVLDGQKLTLHTPAHAQVQRDAKTHKIEIIKGGFAPTSRFLRYDREVNLTVTVSLDPLPPAP
jgi:hypothetical protein